MTTFLKLRTMKTSKHIKKLSLKYKYLTIELQEVKDNLVVYQREFNEYINSLEQTHQIMFPDKKQKNCEKNCSTDQNIEKTKRPKTDKCIKDMYKQVAQQTHPDKTHNDPTKQKMFRQAKQALEQNDLMGMIDLCLDLDMEPPELTKDQLKQLDQNIKTLQQQIQGIKSQDAYVWGAADEQTRQKIEQKILQHYIK